MHKVTELKVLENYKIKLRFDDGIEKIVDLQPFIGRGITESLLDIKNFSKVFIEPGGGIAWENGYDFCPNYLRELPGEK